MRRIAVGGLVHETHTFSPERTSLASFAEQTFYQGDALAQHMHGTATAMGGALQGLNRSGYHAVPLLYAAAMPSGVVTQSAHEDLLAALLQHLAAAMPVDGVLLVLHGAMVSEQQDDCEGEILARVRDLVGPECLVVAVLDMHGNVSPSMSVAADALVAFDTNPHRDGFERGLEAASILQRMLDERLRPTTALVRVPLLLTALTTWTEQPPLRVVHERAKVLERDPRVVNISVMGGFAYADTPFTGMGLVVTTTGDHALAESLAEELADIAWAAREAATYKGRPIKEAVRGALSAPHGPVILADVGDNVGGGSPGDGTVLLQALLEARAHDVVVTLADREAVGRAFQAGVGEAIELAVGGKCDGWHGDPVWVHGSVQHLSDGRFIAEGKDHFAQFYGGEVHMGRSAVLQCGGVRLLLTTKKTPPGDLAQLRSQGIAPEAQQVIVVKSAVAFRSAYEPIATQILEVDTPGLCTPDLRRFVYRKVPRPAFPVDIVPIPAYGSPRSWVIPAHRFDS